MKVKSKIPWIILFITITSVAAMNMDEEIIRNLDFYMSMEDFADEELQEMVRDEKMDQLIQEEVETKEISNEKDS